MAQPHDPNAYATGDSPDQGCGRYRFRAGQAVDPNQDVHPELLNNQGLQPGAACTPDSPEQLIAMQHKSNDHPEKPERHSSPNLKQVLELIDRLNTEPVDDQEIALAMVRKLEGFHDSVVEEMRDDPDAKHSQLVCWAIDADRLMRCRVLLESVDLV